MNHNTLAFISQEKIELEFSTEQSWKILKDVDELFTYSKNLEEVIFKFQTKLKQHTLKKDRRLSKYMVHENPKINRIESKQLQFIDENFARAAENYRNVKTLSLEELIEKLLESIYIPTGDQIEHI